MALRMVATDLDGTIVRPDGTVAPRTLAAFEACLARGVDVVLVTGRPPRWLAPVVEATGLRGIALCGNGALVYDAGTGEVIKARTLSRHDAIEVAERLSRHVPGIAFAVETLAGFRREAGYVPRYDWGMETRTGTLDDLLDDDPGVVKLLCRDENSTGDHLLSQARDLLSGLAEPTHSNAADGLLEVSALGVSKAATLSELAAERGIGPDEVVAFGDMPNDLEMLRWAGRGYAMAGGHADVIAAADEVAPACELDGVAQVIEALLADRDKESGVTTRSRT